MEKVFCGETSDMITIERFVPTGDYSDGESYTDCLIVRGGDAAQAENACYDAGYGPMRSCECEHDCCGHWFTTGWRIYPVDDHFLVVRSAAKNV